MDDDDDGGDDKTTKRDWWQRTALARTGKRAKGSRDSTVGEDEHKGGRRERINEGAVDGPGYRAAGDDDDGFDGGDEDAPTRWVGGGEEAAGAPRLVDKLQGSGRLAGAEARERPGAVAIRGPGYRGGDGDGDGSHLTPARVEGRGGVDDDSCRGSGGDDIEAEATDAPLHVTAYAVKALPTEEEIRQRILASAPLAEAVSAGGRVARWRRWCRARGRVAVAVVVAIAVTVAVVAAPLATRRPQTSPQGASGTQNGRLDEVMASLHYLEWQGFGGFPTAISVKTVHTSETDGASVTLGMFEQIFCRPIVCLESDANCVVGKSYSPGCCPGYCPNQTTCGEQCSPPPESCSLKDPNNKTCIQSGCYTCNQYDGEDIYHLQDYAFSIDCLEVGTAVRPENGQSYKWAIFCGPVVVGPVVEENRDLGEYQCGAARQGANFSDVNGGLLSALPSCQYAALAECGCGPSDMFTFGLPAPAGPCLPDGGCPILCEDAGPAYARNLCRSFPGNITWWEGQNAINISFFYEELYATEYELDIYIQEGFQSP
jgi:hypothetical protein